MCTTVALTMDSFFFGRNMDLEGSFGEGVVITPRNYPFRFRRTEPSFFHYVMIGTATVIDGYPLYADAMNEAGLCAAGLNFPHNAFYPRGGDGTQKEISPFELIPWILGSCATLEEARGLLSQTAIVEEPFSKTVSLTPLHWHIADTSGSLVVEPRHDGVKVYENSVGVLTNNPPFPFQLEMLSRYEEMRNESAVTPLCEPSFFSLGTGGVGLPGDYTSSSRFAKAAFLKRFLCDDGGEREKVARIFSLLGAVAPPKGSVLDAEGKPHYTTYSCCMDTERGIYYVRRADSLSVMAASLTAKSIDGTELFPCE